MRHYLLPILLVLFFLGPVACVSTSKQIALNRDALDKKETWRHQLPKSDPSYLRPVFPNVKRAQLKYGLTVLVVEDHRLPIAQIMLATKAGSARDPFNLGGLSQLTALMLKEGAGPHDSLALAEAFANLGTEVSVSVNKDMVQISAEVLSDKIPKTVGLMSSMVMEPRFNGEDFDRVKLHHASLVSSQQANPSYLAQVNFLKSAYGEKHPYGHPNAGTLRTITNIDLKDIKKAYLSNYGANETALIVVGDITLAEVLDLAKNNLGEWDKAVAPVKHIIDPKAHQEMQTILVERLNSPQTFIMVGMVAINRLDKNLAALEVFQHIIAGLPTSRLGANLREQKGWTYGVQSQLSPLLGRGPLFISSSIQVPFGADALSEILKELEKMKNEPVSDEELSISKNGILNSFASRYSTVGKISSILADLYTYSLPANHEEILYDQIAAITKQDILAAAQKVIKSHQFTAVAVGDLESIKEPLSNMKVGKVTIEKEVDLAPIPKK